MNSIVPAVVWVCVLSCGIGAIGASSVAVTRAVPDVLQRVSPTVERRVPSYIATIAPLPAGSVSAIRPLPLRESPTTSGSATLSVAEPAPPVEPTLAVEAASVGTDQLKVVGNGVNVRSSPKSGSGKVGAIPGGVIVIPLDHRKGWVLVEAPNGLRGWVYGKYLKPG